MVSEAALKQFPFVIYLVIDMLVFREQAGAGCVLVTAPPPGAGDKPFQDQLVNGLVAFSSRVE